MLREQHQSSNVVPGQRPGNSIGGPSLRSLGWFGLAVGSGARWLLRKGLVLSESGVRDPEDSASRLSGSVCCAIPPQIST
jgi:hypothetical protein